MTRSQVLQELHDRIAPVTLSREQLLTVPEPLLPLFPLGGLQRGTSVGFDGAGSTSVALTLAASTLGTDRWMAIVGLEELGLLAASELGVRLDRLLLIESTQSTQLAAVAAALVEAVDIIVIHPRKRLGARDARRLTARSKERGTVLFHLDGGRNWPGVLDLEITTSAERWEGLGQGHGHLRQRHLTVSTFGRRSSARHRQTSILLPGPTGGMAPNTAVPDTAVPDTAPIDTAPPIDAATAERHYARAG